MRLARRFATAGLLLATLRLHASVYYVTVAGLGGEPDYEQRFTETAKDLDRTFHASTGAHVYTLTGAQATKAKLSATLAEIAREAKLERPGRGVIAATKNGTEKNATVFARYWAEALGDPTADVDKSDSISAMEALTYADRKTAAFYESQKRLATEHAVFEDTGKGEGVKVSAAEGRQGAFLGSLTVVRIGAAQAAMNDPAKRELMAKKEELEQKIDALKYQKAAMEPGEYKQQLTAALLELAKVQAQLDQ